MLVLEKEIKEVAYSKEKKKRKDRRRRRGSNMEENNNSLVMRSGSYWMENKENMPINPSITKIYKPLPESLELNINKDHLHSLLQHYLLTEKELYIHKFPRPGSAMGEAFSPGGLVMRKCFRCFKVFHVSVDGKYEVEEECLYHPERCALATPIHPCCKQPKGYPGCTSHFSHVCANPILHNAKFQSVRDKRYIKPDRQNAIYALDCEMVLTGAGLQVAKVGVVNHQGLTIYETYVLPENKVIDYNTTYSGITAKDLQGVTTTLNDVQTYLDQLLNKDSILIGHALNSDLKVLRLLHDRIIDTSVMFPRIDGTKQKLKDLALVYLNEIIQNDPLGHDCIEDARTCMALVLHKLKQDQLANQETQRGNHCPSICEKTDSNVHTLFDKKSHHSSEMLIKDTKNFRQQYILEQINSGQNVLWVC